MPKWKAFDPPLKRSMRLRSGTRLEAELFFDEESPAWNEDGWPAVHGRQLMVFTDKDDLRRFVNDRRLSDETEQDVLNRLLKKVLSQMEA